MLSTIKILNLFANDLNTQYGKPLTEKNSKDECNVGHYKVVSKNHRYALQQIANKEGDLVWPIGEKYLNAKSLAEAINHYRLTHKY